MRVYTEWTGKRGGFVFSGPPDKLQTTESATLFGLAAAGIIRCLGAWYACEHCQRKVLEREERYARGSDKHGREYCHDCTVALNSLDRINKHVKPKRKDSGQ